MNVDNLLNDIRASVRPELHVDHGAASASRPFDHDASTIDSDHDHTQNEFFHIITVSTAVQTEASMCNMVVVDPQDARLPLIRRALLPGLLVPPAVWLRWLTRDFLFLLSCDRHALDHLPYCPGAQLFPDCPV